ncbi:MAG TPA: hybrid sensor histidine kinase/response regulator [Polyangiaceae bacterium]|nr:hybrid sensor histidine kinase/response regulator [Polyangiaceae bacterium]
MMDAAERRALVLVVDDNEQNRALAKAALEMEGFDAVLAASGQEGLAAFEAQLPDCVLLDVRMPGMDGLEACRRLRALPGGQGVPVLFLTALRDVDTFDAALAAGGDDFLTKPIQPTELVLRVQAAVKMRDLDATNKQFYELVKRQRDDLLRLQLQKERLTSFVVHDLKNPVNSIDLLAQLIYRDKKLPNEARETAGSIRLEVAALMRLILNILDINKSEEGALATNSAPLDLTPLVQGVVEALGVRARSREVTLRSELAGLEPIPADADLLRRVLENLVDNALRYTPKGSQIAISALLHETELELRIADQGPGVPAELRENIFDRFVQLGGSGGAAERLVPRTGRGLGLTFCRLAVEAHGGRIYVEDGAPGAVFCIRLPRGS